MNKKITKIIMGTIGVASILAIVPACVVSCGSSSTTNSTPTNSSSTSSSTTPASTPEVGSTVLSSMVTPSASGLKGIQYQTNEFGFGSSVTLNAKFNEPKVKVTSGQKASISMTYSWFANGSSNPIKGATSNSYVVNLLNEDTTYQVNVAYTITITDGTKTINTFQNTVSSSIKLTVNNADLHVNLTYDNNENSTITDYGTQTFKTNIYAVFGTNANDQLALSTSDFPAGYSLQYQELDLPSNKSANDVLPSAIALDSTASLTSTLNVQQSYPIVVNLVQNKQVIATSNAINVCGYVKTDGNINFDSTVPTNTSNQGLYLGNNKFAFGSKLTLTANFAQPVFDLAANQSVQTMSTLYTWTINGKTFTTTNNTYTVNGLYANTSYSVTITYVYQIINSKTKAPLSTPISGALSYNKSINLNVDYSNVKFALNASDLNKNNQIINFGYQSLTTNLEVSFDNNKTYIPLNASDFTNFNYQIEFGTLSNDKFDVFSSNDASSSQAWSTSYVIENATELQAQINLGNNNVIKSNVISTNITNPSVGLSACLSTTKNAVGKQIATNEFAFGSQVTLTADFIHPAINQGSGITTTDNVTYTWYKNGAVIKGVSSSTYTIPYFLTSDTYSVSVNWAWSITKDNATTSAKSNLEAINQTYKSNNLSLTVDNSNLAVNLSYGNNETSTITSASDVSLKLITTVTAKFGNDTITIPNDELTSNLSNWKITYQRFAFNQWNTLSSNEINNENAFTYKCMPTGVYPIQAQLTGNNRTYNSNLIQVNTSYNDDVLGLDNIPASLQSTYNFPLLIQNYINLTIEGEGGNSPFMQQVNAWANGYLIVQNTKPASNQQWVSVSPIDLGNIQVTWTNTKNHQDGVTVSATVENANGLLLINYNNGKPAYGNPENITVNKGDIIKWLFPFGGTQLGWSVTNNQVTVNMQVNNNLVPNVITSFPKNGKNEWYAYQQPESYPSIPGMNSYFWGFTAESSNGTNLLTNALQTNKFYQDINDTQWVIFGSLPILGDNINNPAIILDSNTSSLVQPLYNASIKGISSLK